LVLSSPLLLLLNLSLWAAVVCSVGSKAISVNQAVMIGAVFEFLGALIGGGASGFLSKGILSPEVMNEDIYLYSKIMFCMLGGAFTWLAFATFFSLPVSTTHSLGGAILGTCSSSSSCHSASSCVRLFTSSALPGLGFMEMGSDNMNWMTIKKMIVSWLVSPLMGCLVAHLLFRVVVSTVLAKANPVREANRVVPYFSGFTFGLITLFLFLNGPKSIRLGNMPALGASLSAAALASMYARAFTFGDIVVATAAKDAEIPSPSASSTPTSNGLERGDGAPVIVKSEAPPLDSKATLAEDAFGPLMVTTACTLAFAHGANDIANCIGPFNVIYEISTYHSVSMYSPVPLWILLLGGCGIGTVTVVVAAVSCRG